MKMLRVMVFVVVAALCLLPASALAGKGSKKTPDPLPGPQLVTDAWMFLAAYKVDPEVLRTILPPDLKPHPNNHVVINMYTVPDHAQTSGFGDYTLTYLTIEIEGDDSYEMGKDITYPGRYFVYYFNSSEKMRKFTKAAGIPAESGTTTTKVKNGKLKAKLKVGGRTMIEAKAKVGTEQLGPMRGGHLNYFGNLDGIIVKYPIPWVGAFVSSMESESPKIKFKAPKNHPLNKLKPTGDPTWAVWMKGSFVYPQHQVVNLNTK